MIEYDEEDISNWEKFGGGYLLREGIIDTDDIEEIRKFRRGEIEKVDNEEDVKSFSITKLKNERSDTMREYLNDSGFNEVEELEDLIEKFDDEDLDDDFLKQIKVIPQKLKNALQECYKILNEYKSDIKDLSPELFSAISVLGKLATGKPGKEPYPYPYPSKIKKSEPMSWQGVQDLLFGGHIPADDYEVEKSSKSNPFPSITRALKIKKEAIDDLEDEMEEDAFNPDDRRI